MVYGQGMNLPHLLVVSSFALIVIAMIVGLIRRHSRGLLPFRMQVVELLLTGVTIVLLSPAFEWIDRIVS